jgi:hypothetical protein
MRRDPALASISRSSNVTCSFGSSRLAIPLLFSNVSVSDFTSSACLSSYTSVFQIRSISVLHQPRRAAATSTIAANVRASCLAALRFSIFSLHFHNSLPPSSPHSCRFESRLVGLRIKEVSGFGTTPPCSLPARFSHTLRSIALESFSHFQPSFPLTSFPLSLTNHHQISTVPFFSPARRNAANTSTRAPLKL